MSTDSLFCQPVNGVGDGISHFQESGDTQTVQNGLAFCQPVSDDKKLSLDREDVNNFIQWAKAKAETTDRLDIPLREWVSSEGQITDLHKKDEEGPHFQLDRQRADLLRKITVGFAIGKLLQHIKASVASYSQEELLRLCFVDNFTVHMSTEVACKGKEGWGVVGVDMISPPLSLQVAPTASFDSNNYFASSESENGGEVAETKITRHSPFCCAKRAAQDGTSDDNSICYAFGVLLNFIFSGETKTDNGNPQETQNVMDDFLRSLSISPEHLGSNDNPGISNVETEATRPTKSIRMPSQTNEVNLSPSFMSGSLSRIVRDLLGCNMGDDLLHLDTAYKSLDSAINDMHLLLLEPKKFLFESNDKLPAVTNMHGRSSEAKVLLDAFCRVGSTGQSEAIFVKGFSGSGKTRLVQSVFGSVIAANGLIVNKKFEENSTNQLSLVLSAFDDLCILLAGIDHFNKESFEPFWHQLLSEFGSNLSMLVRIVPSIVRLAPSTAAALAMVQDHTNEGDVNFFSLCDMIKRFMRAISSSLRPVMLFLDDLQWADSVSLGLVHTVLSDKKGASSMFFVGSYRENEVPESHIINGFSSWLSEFNVPQNTIHLDGMPEDDVNSIVSDSLGMLPRLCRPLSQVVFRKTEGNPFFLQTFLRSLVGKNLLTYNLREKSWLWDIDEIYIENITPNVLDLLASKMSHLSENVQTALKISSCFGIKVAVSIVNDLSKTPEHSSLLADLNKAVEDGLMDLDADGLYYRFVHDKVREAAYDMISQDIKNKYHFDIGMCILASYASRMEERGAVLIAVLDQINRGVPSLLRSDSQRISIAQLNYDAASEALGCYNYTMAYQLSKTATSLLPADSWSLHYDLSLKFYFLLSKAAYSCRKIDEAKDALCKVVDNANSLQTKLDAYTLQHSILFNACVPKEMGQLLVTMISVLMSLGENFPNGDVTYEAVTAQVDLATAMFGKESDESLLESCASTSENHVAIMQAYNILVLLSYVAKPKLFPYYAARWAQYYLRNKVSCRHTSALYLLFALVLCQDMGSKDILEGYRIGKLGLRMLNQHDSCINEIPMGYAIYYGHVGILFEPIQACIDMHRKAVEIGYQVGNTSAVAIHKQFLIPRQFHAGTNLNVLKEELELVIKMTDQHYSFPMLREKMQNNYKFVLALIGDQSSSSSHLSDGESDLSVYDQKIAQVYYQIICLTYLGHYERAVHMFKGWEQLSGENETKKIASRDVQTRFYYGLSLFGLRRQKKPNATKVNVNYKEWFDAVKTAAKCSRWNFQNKASLLMAEKLSLSLKHREAEVEYDAAIKHAQSSKFIHEEGLACELAGMHHERLGHTTRALELFIQAEHCYEAWGSKVKTRQMAEKIRHNSEKQT